MSTLEYRLRLEYYALSTLECRLVDYVLSTLECRLRLEYSGVLRLEYSGV